MALKAGESKLSKGMRRIRELFHKPKSEKAKRISGLEQAKLNISLYYAVRGNEPDEIRRLIKAGADVGATWESEVPLLAHAAFLGNAESCKALIEGGADANAKDKVGRTMLMYAVQKESFGICALLVEKGADVNIRDKEGISALQEAAVRNEPDICKLLILHGADASSVIKALDNLYYNWHSMKGNGVWVGRAEQTKKFLVTALDLAGFFVGGVDSLRHSPRKADKGYSLFMESFNLCISGK
jgi:hypothetical protein